MILIVDDSPAIQNLITNLLVERGHTHLAVATSAEEARLALESNGQDLDLILLDVHLPGMDGLSFCQDVTQSPATAEVPVLIMTGDTRDEVLEASFEAGARDYVRKPVGRRELIARVEAALRLRRESKQRLRHLTELRELNQILTRANTDLTEKATMDGLTGLANRRHLDNFLELAWEDARKTDRPLSLLMIDVDEFKSYNDHYGHPKGDTVLARVAGAIENCLVRPDTLAARYGGEEFCVVLPSTDRNGAALQAERLLAAVRGLGIPHGISKSAAIVTVSVGVCTRLPGKHERSSELVVRADEALYEAKHGGRNRKAVYGAH